MIVSIKEHLFNNIDDLIKVLKYFKYKNITTHNSEIRCAKPNGNNESTCRIKLNEYLNSNDFSLAYKGDLFGLIELHGKLDFSDIIDIVKSIINKKIVSTKEEVELPFEGFFEDIYVSHDVEVLTYPESVLESYGKVWNKRFCDDHIKPRTQLDFHIGYDEDSQRITIPWRNIEGEVCGIMGRLNKDEPTKYKYLPIIAFAKQFSLYGIYENKEYIKNNRVYIFESEKSVLQLHSYGYKNAVSLGGNAIHSYQIELLLKLNVKEIILCYDEGLEKEVIKNAITEIKDNLFMRDDIRLGVMIDKNNEILPEGSKCSPSDLGKESWEYLLNNSIKYLNK